MGRVLQVDMNGDGKLTAGDLEAMKAMMAKGENVLVAVKPGGEGGVKSRGNKPAGCRTSRRRFSP